MVEDAFAYLPTVVIASLCVVVAVAGIGFLPVLLEAIAAASLTEAEIVGLAATLRAITPAALRALAMSGTAGQTVIQLARH